MASERVCPGILASVRSTARLASLRSNCANALALSGLLTILSCSRDVLLLRTAASRAAKRASGLVGSPTANTSVSEFFSHIRPAQTVAMVRMTVRMANNRIWALLLLTTARLRLRGFSTDGVGTSALMALDLGPGAIRPPFWLPATARTKTKYLKKNENFPVPG